MRFTAHKCTTLRSFEIQSGQTLTVRSSTAARITATANATLFVVRSGGTLVLKDLEITATIAGSGGAVAVDSGGKVSRAAARKLRLKFKASFT